MGKREIFIIFVLLLISFCIFGQNRSKYVIHGTADKELYEGERVYLMKTALYGGINLKLDSTSVKHGKFKFRGEVNELPHLLQVIIFSSPKFESKDVFVILEKGNIKMQIEKDREQVGGTPMNDALNDKISQPLKEWWAALSIYSLKKDSMPQNLPPFPQKEVDRWYAGRADFVKAYAEYPVVDAFLFEMIIMNSLKADELLAIKKRLCSESRERIDERIKTFNQMLEQTSKENNAKRKIEDEKKAPEAVKLGKRYVDFRGLTLEGDTVKLSDIIVGKKLVLLDFWASWCGPCINMVPFVDSLYQKFHPQGLEIVGASCDNQIPPWKKTVNTRQMCWPQILMLRADEENGACIYGIHSIPYTLLIDNEGKIIARRLRGKELELTIEKWLEEHK